MPLYHEEEHGPFHIRVFRNVDEEVNRITVSLRKQWTLGIVFGGKTEQDAIKAAKGPILDTDAGGTLKADMKLTIDYNEVNWEEPRVQKSWLVQALGNTRRSNLCNRCDISTDNDHDLWLKCRTVKTLYDGACGNCKRQEKSSKCSLASTYEAEITAERKWDAAEDKALASSVHKHSNDERKRTCFKDTGYFNG